MYVEHTYTVSVEQKLEGETALKIKYLIHTVDKVASGGEHLRSIFINLRNT